VVTHKNQTVFNDAENAIIQKSYASKSLDELMALLPGRTIRQIRSRAAKLGCKRTHASHRGKSKRFREDKDDKPLTTPERDGLHVATCLAGGGFPTVQITNGQTVWLWPSARMAA